jgi:hypothetical protein
LTLGAPAAATARRISSDGCAWTAEAAMHAATVAEMMIAVIFGFEFMILAGPFYMVYLLK